MKKLILIAVFAFYATIASAESLSLTDALKKLPGVKQGAAYSVIDSKFNYLSTIDVAKYKGFNLEIGAAYDSERTGVKAIALVSYDLLKVKDVVNLPILDLIEFRPGVGLAYGRIEGFEDGDLKGEGDVLVTLSVINIKF
jgi:hypothetical protein